MTNGGLPFLTTGHAHSAAPRFTLMEVMIVIALTGVAITAAVGLLSTVMWGANMTRHRLTASNIANNRIEELRSLPYAEVPAMEEDRVIVNGQGVRDGDGEYVRTTEIGTDFLKTRQTTVSVETKWKHDMPPLTITVTTIVADENLLKK